MDGRDLLPGEYAALGLLALEPAHGYELHRRWQASRLSEVLRLEQSVLYGYLRTLDRRGLLDWEEHRIGNRPPRKIYRPSELGEAFLRAWLRTPVRALREVRADLLLKLHILALHDPRAEATLLDRQLAICETLLEDARSAVAGEPDPAAFCSLFQQSRAASAEAALLWLRSYREHRRDRARAS